MADGMLPPVAPDTPARPRASEAQDQLLPALLSARKNFKPIRRGAEGVTADVDGTPNRYRYADLAGHLQAVEGALLEAGLLLEQDIERVGSTYLMVTRLIHAASGQWRSGALPIRPPQTDDPHATGSLLTYMRRYGLATFLALAPVDDDDGFTATVAAKAEARAAKEEGSAPIRKARAPKVIAAPEPGQKANAPEASPLAEPQVQEPPQPAWMNSGHGIVMEVISRVGAARVNGDDPAEVWKASADLLRHELVSKFLIEDGFDRYVALVGDVPPPIDGLVYPDAP